MAEQDSTPIVYGPTHRGKFCVDLRAMFPGKFRFEWDDTYEHELKRVRERDAAWLTQIPGERGRIYPYGGRLLAAYSDKRSAVKALCGLEGVQIRQLAGSNAECVVTYDISEIEKMAQILQSKRKSWG